jgi:hypothetical protein
MIRALIRTAWQHNRTALLIPVMMLALPLVAGLLAMIGE